MGDLTGDAVVQLLVAAGFVRVVNFSKASGKAAQDDVATKDDDGFVDW